MRPKPKPITDYIFTDHARIEIRRRGLSEEMVRAILLTPEQRIEVRPGRDVLNRRFPLGKPERRFCFASLWILIDTLQKLSPRIGPVR